MELHKVRNLAEYQALLESKQVELSSLAMYEKKLTQQFKQLGAFCCEGVSWPIKNAAKFMIDDCYSETGEINWRERLVCQETQFNNRIRGAIHLFEQSFKPESQDSIYITEQHTVLYKWFKRQYSGLVGSEYLTASNWFNRIKFMLRLFPDTLVHQDLTQLTYPNDGFNYVLSFDCFEHIPNYLGALAELYRVTKKGGKLLFSVPFDCNSATTLTRATTETDGSITHHTEPEYHGNPVSKLGSLSYYTFGWDLLDRLKDAGFNQAYALVYWSEKYAYLGGPQLLLCAEK